MAKIAYLGISFQIDMTLLKAGMINLGVIGTLTQQMKFIGHKLFVLFTYAFNHFIFCSAKKFLLYLSTIIILHTRHVHDFCCFLVSQDYKVQNSQIFTGFFLNAQLETQSAPGEPASIDVFLMNGHKITVDITSTGQCIYIGFQKHIDNAELQRSELISAIYFFSKPLLNLCIGAIPMTILKEHMGFLVSNVF